MGKQTSGRTKKMLGISMLIFFVISMTAASVSAQATTTTDSDQGSATPSIASKESQSPRISVAVINPCAPLKVQFRLIFNPREIRILSERWNFGDGTTATNIINPTHIYRRAGTYNPTVTLRFRVISTGKVIGESLVIRSIRVLPCR